MKSANLVWNCVLLSQDYFDSLVFCDLMQQNRPRRDGESTQKNYTKNLNDPDNHNAVHSHSEPDILECEVKWILRSIAAHKSIGGDRFPAKLFKILKDDAIKVLHSTCQKIWKSQQWQRTRQGQSSSQLPRRAVN